MSYPTDNNPPLVGSPGNPQNNPNHITAHGQVNTALVALGTQVGIPASPGFGSLLWASAKTLGLQNLIVFGDSYSDPGNYQAVQSQGFPAYESNGPCWPVILAYALGLPSTALPRWGSGFPAGLNYAFTGATVNSSSPFGGHTYGLNYQVSQFLTDFGNTVPPNSLIIVAIGTNDAISFALNQIGGMPSTADPVTTVGTGGFTQPASQASVTIPVTSTTPFAVGNNIWIVNGGSYNITAINAGVSIVATLTTVFPAVTPPGGTVAAGNNIRWLAAQWIDNSLNGASGFPGLAQQLTALVNAGATEIIVFDVSDPAITPEYAPQGATGTNCKNYWNTGLNTLLGGYPKATLFQMSTVFSNVFTNPPSYGIYNTDSFISVGGSQDLMDVFMWANNFHPSAAMHRILAQAVLSKILTLYSSSYQTKQAGIVLPAAMAPNLAPAPQFSSPNGFQVAPWVGNIFPQIITSADLRLPRSTFAVDSPFGMRRFWSDFNSGTVPEPNYKSTVNKVATGNGQAQIGNYGFDFGGEYLYTAALNDVYGEIFTGATFYFPNSSGAGQFYIGYRFAMPMANAGDTVTLQFGLGDSLTALANGLVFNVSNTNGVLTGSVQTLVAGAATTQALTLPNLPINGNGALLIELRSDSDVFRFGIWVAGVFQILWAPKVSLSGNLNPFHQVKRTAFVSGVSGVVADGFCVIHFLART